LAVDLMTNALQSISNLDRNSLKYFASEEFACHCAPICTLIWLIFYFFLSVSCLPQSLMLECLHFSPITASLYYDGWMSLQLGRC